MTLAPVFVKIPSLAHVPKYIILTSTQFSLPNDILYSN